MANHVIQLMSSSKSSIETSNQSDLEGNGSKEAIAVGEEDAVTQAVQVLSNLAGLKLKVQELRGQAMQVRSQVDLLFSDEVVSEEAIASLKDGFKVLKTFAQTNLRFREAKSQAEQARAVLDQALRLN